MSFAGGICSLHSLVADSIICNLISNHSRHNFFDLGVSRLRSGHFWLPRLSLARFWNMHCMQEVYALSKATDCFEGTNSAVLSPLVTDRVGDVRFCPPLTEEERVGYCRIAVVCPVVVTRRQNIVHGLHHTFIAVPKLNSFQLRLSQWPVKLFGFSSSVSPCTNRTNGSSGITKEAHSFEPNEQ